MPGTPQVEHKPQERRFSVSIDGRESRLDYVLSGEGQSDGGPMVITHTYVPPEGRGQGIAAALVREALAFADAQGMRVVPQCSYVQSYIDRHPEHQRLVAGGG